MATAVDSYIYGTALLSRWDAEIPIARTGHTQYLPVRALCLVLGIDSPSQLEVMRADSRYAPVLREIPIQTSAGWRVAVWIRRKEGALWLAGIDPARCKLSARGPLADFQADLMREADRLLLGGAPRVPVPQRAQVEYHQRERLRIVCPDCGAPMLIEIADGAVTVTQERADGNEREP